MAHPVVETTATTAYSANQTSHAINLPSGIQSGDCLVIWFCKDGTSGTTTQPSGWTLDATVTQGDQSFVMTKTADGTESGTVTVTTSASESSTAIALRISGHSGKQIAGLAVSSATIFGNPPTLTPSSDSDAMVIGLGSALGGFTVTAKQNGDMTEVFQAGNAADTNNTVCAYALYASRVVGTTVNVAPPTWSWSQSQTHRVATVLIHGISSAGGGYPRSRIVNGH